MVGAMGVCFLYFKTTVGDDWGSDLKVLNSSGGCLKCLKVGQVPYMILVNILVQVNSNNFAKLHI